MLTVASVRDDVARHAARDSDGVQPLAVHQSVHLGVRRLVRCEDRQHGSEVVDRVVSDPGAGGVRPQSAKCDRRAGRAVASTLDLCARGLAQDREIALEQVWPVAREPAQAVEGGFDLLVVVPDPGEVDRRRRQLGREFQRDGDAALHVDGAAADEEAVDLDHAAGSC